MFKTSVRIVNVKWLGYPLNVVKNAKCLIVTFEYLHFANDSCTLFTVLDIGYLSIGYYLDTKSMDRSFATCIYIDFGPDLLI